MENVASLSDARAKRALAKLPPKREYTVTRTPELALIMAVIEALPKKTRSAALMKVMQIGNRCPNCETSQAAATLAATLTLALEGR